jgi:hypothetical protein
MSATMDHGTEPVTEPVTQPAPQLETEPETQREQVHPLDEERQRPVDPEAAPVAARRGRGLGLNRHLGSVLLSFLAVLGAYGALDYGFYRAFSSAQAEPGDGALSDQTMIALGVAGLCLLLAAAAGRISGLGPLLAGLVLGAAPAAWVFLDFTSYVQRLDDVPELWEHTTFGLSYVAFAVYPVVAGLLLGAALAGRWRRPAVSS